MNISGKVLKSVLFLSLLLFGSCERETEQVTPTLDFVATTLPTGSISARGGTLSIEVVWAYTRWRVIPGQVIEGRAFIGSSAPDLGGNTEMKHSRTPVTINIISNNTHNTNRQELRLASFDGQIEKRITLTQSPLGFEPFDLIIDPTITHQTIDGFGGANMIWGSDFLTPAEMEMAFGTTGSGLGLSILRIRLSSDRNEWGGLVNIVRDANARGVKVMASPWSPPAIWKSNNSINGGGFLLHQHYADFANYINEFITFMASRGAVIDVVSIQNEPDIQVSYEGCEYTIEEMFNFVRNHAGSIQGARVMAAESFNFKHSYTDQILNDPVAVNNIDIVGFHIYGGGRHGYPLAEQKGKPLWMTEHLYNLDSGNFPNNWTATTSQEVIWNETMLMLTDIHDGMTFNWNAYIWWYIRRYYSFLGDGTRGTTRGTMLKRGHAIAQYSRFIRPGYVRISANFDFGIAGIKATAYRGADRTVVVILNTTSHDGYKVNLIAPTAVTSATSFTTSLNLNREETMLSPAGNKVMVNLPASSITTIVFQN